MRIGDGLTTVQICDADGEVQHSWPMDIVGTYRRIEAARRGQKEDGDPFAHLDQFKELVKAAGGPDLNDAQADELYDSAILEQAKKKSAREAALLCVQTLPSSLPSTQRDSAPTT